MRTHPLRAARIGTALAALAAIGLSTLLHLSAGGAAPRSTAGARSAGDADAQEAFLVRAGLEAVGDEDWFDVDLDALAARLRKQLGCRAEVDHAALRKQDRPYGAKGVATPARGARLRDALELSLDLYGATYAIDGDVLRITTYEAAATLRRDEAIHLDVTDLFQSDGLHLSCLALLSNISDPHGKGAPDAAYCTATMHDGGRRRTLTVQGTERQQQAAARLLDDLREAAAQVRDRPERKLLPRKAHPSW